tara:strand:- start:211 stop:447 length:237 start_codon:yes stop_codon:yes gene_type:complete
MLINTAKAYYLGMINRRVANVEVLLNQPVGIGEHGDIQEEIEKHLGIIADYHDKIEILEKYFNKKEESKDENTEKKSK